MVLELVDIDLQQAQQIAPASRPPQKKRMIHTPSRTRPARIVAQPMPVLSTRKTAGNTLSATVPVKRTVTQHRLSPQQAPANKHPQPEKTTGPPLSPPRQQRVVTPQVATQHAQSGVEHSNQTMVMVRKHLESYKYYPASARRRGIEGHVDVSFRLIPDGSADQVSVLHGSGYAVLDHAALETVYRAQPFPIGRGKYRFRLTFKRL